MSMDVAIRNRLVSQTGITNLIGGSTTPRIFPETRAQESALPCLVYSTNSEEALGALVGVKAWKADVEIVAVATTKAAALGLATAVIAGLDGYAGTDDSTTIMHALHLRSVTAYNAPLAGETTGVFLHTVVFSVMYA